MACDDSVFEGLIVVLGLCDLCHMPAWVRASMRHIIHIDEEIVNELLK